MTTMFTNYESAIHKQPCGPNFHTVSQKNSKIITNIKGETLGVQVKQSGTLQLYFHLENIHEVNFEDLLNGMTLFEVLTTTHKVILSHSYYTTEILNQNTNDLFIISGVAIVYSAFYITVILIVDILYGIIDPRIRLAGGK